MRLWLPALLLLALSEAAPAQVGGDLLTTRSASGQFLVRVQPPTLAAVLPPDLLTNRSYLELAPTLLAISSERIRKALNQELVITAPPQDRIYLDIVPGRPGVTTVTLTAERFRREWVYRVTLPRVVERREYVRAMVSVLLLEFANRGAMSRSAEVPSWLAEGLTQQLLAARETELLLPPPSVKSRGVTVRTIATESRQADPLAAARQNLRARAPLTIEELSWPTAAQLAGEDDAVFHHSAQVFVTELLRLKTGAPGVREFLRLLPECYNWQTAFQRAFPNQFANPLALEKWWTLQVVHLSGRDPGQLWPPNESWQKLEEKLQVTIAVRQNAGELPRHQTVTLSEVIGDWAWREQRPVLLAKLQELQLMRLRLAQEFLPLVDDYQRALQDYLNRRARSIVSVTNPRAPANNAWSAVREVLARLELLDAQRLSLRPMVDAPNTQPPEAATVTP